MTKRRILFDGRVLTRSEPSGIRAYTEALLNALIDLNKQNEFVVFINSFRSHKAQSRTFFEKRVQTLNWHLPNKLLDLTFRLAHFPAVDQIARANLVFSPHFTLLESKKAPKIVTFHDLSFLHHPYFFSRKQRFWHWLQDFRRQANQATMIIAVSEFTKHDIVNLLKIPPERIRVIYSGVEDRFRPLPAKLVAAFRHKHRLNNQVILYLGTLEPRKNVPAIIRAFNIVKNRSETSEAKLVLAGRPGWLYQSILHEAKRSPYQKDIVFWGSTSAEEQILLYNVARVFAYPSFFEGFGFPPLEAQACGTPVIVSDRTSLAEIIGQSGRLVDPWQVQVISEAISKLLVDENERSRLIKLGTANAARFSWTEAAKKTLTLFEDVG